MTNISQGKGRIEDDRFIRGAGRFTADLTRAGQAYGAVVRSQCAHADITGVETSDAKAMPGVLAVWTAADLATDGLGDLQNTSTVPSDPPMVHPPRPVLAKDRVRHTG
ncbi:MAG: xanthine dehydrogenase family protein molybdopterin-binding subunit, partial [Alphaproteobacteria bacterium]